MATRVVTGTFSKADGTPLSGKAVKFTLKKGTYSATNQYPKNPTITGRTNATGLLKAADGLADLLLWVDAEAVDPTPYVCTVDQEKFEFTIPVGTTPIDLSILRANGPAVPPANSTLQFLVDTHAAVKASATVLGHVKLSPDFTIESDGTLHNATSPDLSGYATTGALTTEAATRAAADVALQALVDANTTAIGTKLAKASNLSDLASIPTARTNLGLGSLALLSSITASQVSDFSAAADARIANWVGAAPATLDTLNELAAALGNDANFAATTATSLGNRLRVDTAAQGLSGTQQSNARTNLGLGSLALLNALTKADVGLGNVENTALSTWAGSANLTTAGALTATSLATALLNPSGNIVELRNGLNAQTLLFDASYTDASNYTRGKLAASTTAITLAAESAGTGSANVDIMLTPKGTGGLKFSTDNTWDIGASGANRPRDVYAAGNIIASGAGSTLPRLSITSDFLQLPSGGDLRWPAKGHISSPANGIILIDDNAGTSFNRLQFGGTTASFPALKRSGTVLQHRTASDSAYAECDALEYRASGTKVIGTQGAAVADATDATSVITQLNLLLARLRAATGHGLIA